MLNKKISVFSLFLLFALSRIITQLTTIELAGSLSSGWDKILVLLCGFFINLLLFLPALLLFQKSTDALSPFGGAVKKLIAVIYAAIFLLTAIKSIARFDFFASSSMSSHSPYVLFSVLLAAAACYASIMGLRGLSGAAGIAGFLLAVSLAVVALMLYDKYDFLSVEPPFSNSVSRLLGSVVTSCPLMPEAAAAAILAGNVKGSFKKGLFIFLPLLFTLVCALAIIPSAVFGGAADTRLFAFYQSTTAAEFGSVNRLDPLFVSLWIAGVLVKSSLFLYCALFSLQSAFERVNKKAAAISMAAVAAVAASFLSESYSLVASPLLSYSEQILTLAGAAVIPIISIIAANKSARRVGR